MVNYSVPLFLFVFLSGLTSSKGEFLSRTFQLEVQNLLLDRFIPNNTLPLSHTFSRSNAFYLMKNVSVTLPSLSVAQKSLGQRVADGKEQKGMSNPN